MIVLKLIVWHQTIVSVTETSSKMASTLAQIWLTILCQEAQYFVYIGLYDCVQISPACGQNTYQIIYGKTLDFQCHYQQW